MLQYQLKRNKTIMFYGDGVLEVHNYTKFLFIPKPLDVGVRHGDKYVVPSRGPLDGIVFL